MESAVGFGVRGCLLTGNFFVVFDTVLIIVVINEIVTGIIRRVDINHFDFAEIRFLQKF